MARPNKKILDKRKKLQELNLFIRDSSLYTSFEKRASTMDDIFIPYIFCEDCNLRNFAKKDKRTYLNYHNKKNDEQLKSLYKNFKNIYTYILSINQNYLLHEMEEDEEYMSLLPYIVSNRIYHIDIKNILGEELADEYAPKGYTSYEHLRYDLDSEELNKVHEYYKNHEDWKGRYTTLIEKHHTDFELHSVINANKNKKVFVELDFTKPLDELIKFITIIKNDFDNDSRRILNLHDYIEYTDKIYKCDLTECDIYKKDKKKSIGGKFADILFIYDCKYLNKILEGEVLTNEYILDEINSYWTEKRNLYKDKMQLATLKEYAKIAQEYIDEEKYKCYLTGYDFHFDSPMSKECY